MIETFLSRPKWVSSTFSTLVDRMIEYINSAGFQTHTIGQTKAALKSPFDEVDQLIKNCRCSIIMGFPHIYAQQCRIKDTEVGKSVFATEWNQIEAALSLVHKKPTLVLIHQVVALRGIFAPGAANLFVHQYNFGRQNWRVDLGHKLDALRSAVDA